MKIIKICCYFIFILCLVGCNNKKNSPMLTPTLEPTSTSKKTEAENLISKVEETLTKLSLDEKIGQMLVISYRSSKFDSKIENTLKTLKPGGIILFKENITTYQQTVNYINMIKQTADIPIIIGIDQEGGNVQRIKTLPDANVLTIPYMYYLGQTGDSKLSYKVGTVVGEELGAFGINLDYAPSIDIFSNPSNTVIGKRAFGTDAKTVIDMSFPFAEGLKDSGIIPVMKHFPGHGDTVIDSHVGLPVVTKTKEELMTRELLPFQEAVKRNADIIMVAHISFPNITGDNQPASLSQEIVTNLLREEMGYQGVVTTDAVDMKALSDRYTTKEICTKAIQAGVDMILMSQESSIALASIKESLQEGIITEEQINAAVTRILTMKYKNKLTNDITELKKESIGSIEHQQIINQIPLP